MLFLDFDGVLNRLGVDYNTPHRQEGSLLIHSEPELVFRLNNIVDKTECRLVLSSAWRHIPKWRATMKANGIVFPFWDKTPKYADAKKLGVSNNDLIRGHNIKEWLMDHGSVKRYAIVDDLSEMLVEQQPNLFRTKTHVGLTQEIADAITKHLS